MGRRQELRTLYRDRSGVSEGADRGLIGGLLLITALALLDLITMINLLGALVIGTMVAAALSTPGRTVGVAQIAQQTVLRPLPPLVGQAELAVRYASAAEEALIGGDLYDAVATEFGVRVIVGDVRGKGLDGVRLAAVC